MFGRRRKISQNIMKNKAIVLLSGGLDSTTTLYLVKNKYKCFCLIFDYGQRHRKEIENAKNVAKI